ncbi:MarR family winged helix-turn-helix transcriptional regulator [Agromyces seonyuensis]|uniref:MarR family transcriptional regulator n=1 Tax=Agromyces seonyuensis TaxID=2662446 RepID=A0A6I4NU95_9MICO|nr:MarR family transcriptional regulator [Agromyces seonyuensis]MWB97813.1 MarR family transcriptional regulator [Agromyces seonyuensis]
MTESRQAAISAAGAALQRYQRSVQRFDDAVGRALGVNAADMRSLDRLSEGSCTAGELAAATGLRPAATTALVDRLSERGLVRRRTSPEDRRRVLVELTPEGRAQVWAAYGPLVEEGAVLLEGIDTEQIVAMGALFERMTAVTDLHRARVEG